MKQLGELSSALRYLLRNRVPACFIVAILGVGMGACVATFSFIDALLFRPLPVRDPETLIALAFLAGDGTPCFPNVSRPYLDELSRCSEFKEIAGYANISAKVDYEHGSTLRALGQIVTANYFDVTGLSATLGRLFKSDEMSSDARSCIVISHDFWKRNFGGSTDALGKIIFLNRKPFEVVGVAPPNFRGLNALGAQDFWILTIAEKDLRVHATYDVIGRLKDGVSTRQAVDGLNRICEKLSSLYGSSSPPGFERYGLFANGITVALHHAAYGKWGPQRGGRENVTRLAVLFAAAVSIVLLVACSNAAGLLLAQAVQRRGEIAIRIALGASRSQIAKQLLTENLVLSASAALVGGVVAKTCAACLMSQRTGDFTALYLDVHFDYRLLLFSSLLMLATTLSFGLFPLLETLRVDVFAALKQETPLVTASGRGFSLRNILVVLQVCLSLALLVCATMCANSLAKLNKIDPGFRTEGLLVIDLAVDANATIDQVPRALDLDRIIQEVRSVPGVKHATVASRAPLSSATATLGISSVERYVSAPGEKLQASFLDVGPGYFNLMRTKILLGREFDGRDGKGAQPTVIVNHKFVNRFWRDEAPLGLKIDGRTVVGVVADSRLDSLSASPQPQLYYPILQRQSDLVTILLESDLGAGQILTPLRARISQFGTVQVSRVQSMRGVISSAMAERAFLGVAFFMLAGFAVLLAGFGLYALVSLFVTARTKEIGIRMALGASRWQIVKLVASRATLLLLIGIPLGLGLAAILGRPLAGLLFITHATDIPVVLIAVLILIAIACVAGLIPARRAWLLEPAAALRRD